MNMIRTLVPRLLTIAFVGVSLAVLAACETPRGSTGGRIDPYRSTAADENSGQANIPALLEFSDGVVDKLAQEISEIDSIRSAPTKSVLEMGTLLNQTQTPTGDFELLRTRVQSRIFDSKLIRRSFVFVENRSRMNQEAVRIDGDTSAGDILQEGKGGVQPSAKYDPKITYVLQGDFYEAIRSAAGVERRQFFLRFKLVNLYSREIVFQKDYDLAQAR